MAEHEDLSNHSDEYLLERFSIATNNLAAAQSGYGPFVSAEHERELAELRLEILDRMKRGLTEDKFDFKNNDLNDVCDNMPGA